MTQSQEPNEDSRISRQLRTVTRLEDTQITSAELDLDFNKVYDEVDENRGTVSLLKQSIAALDAKVDRLDAKLDSQGAKLDSIIRRLSGEAA